MTRYPEYQKSAESLTHTLRFAVFNPTIHAQSIAWESDPHEKSAISKILNHLPFASVSIKPVDSRSYLFHSLDVQSILEQQALFLTSKQFNILAKKFKLNGLLKDCFFFIHESQEMGQRGLEKVVQVSPIIVNEGFFLSEELAKCAAIRVKDVLSTIFYRPEDANEKSNYYKLMVEPDIYTETGAKDAGELFEDMTIAAEIDVIGYALSKNKLTEYLQAYKSIVSDSKELGSVTITSRFHSEALRYFAREINLPIGAYLNLVKHKKISLPLLKSRFDAIKSQS